MILTPTQAAILAAAQQHLQHRVAPPSRLAPAPRDAIRKSLLAKGLIELAVVDAPDETTAWAADGGVAYYRLAGAGLRAAGGVARAVSPIEVATAATDVPEARQAPPVAEGTRKAHEGLQEPASAIPAASHRMTLRDAATALLAALDASSDRAGTEEAISSLRTALAGKTPRQPRQSGAPRASRDGTKQQQVLAMLRRPEGATVAQIAEATGWQHHTVRGFFAGLKKRQGIAVEATERVRQVGTDSAKGSYSVYRMPMPADRRHGAAPRYAVGLYRVSTAEQGHSGLGLEAQQPAVRVFCAAQGWTLVAEYSDVASDKDDRRPGFQAALTRCRQLGAMLVAARLDRITRRAHTLSQLLEDGVSIRAADMPGADDLMMRIYAAMAQKERADQRADSRCPCRCQSARMVTGRGSRSPARCRAGRGEGRRCAAWGCRAGCTPVGAGGRAPARRRRVKPSCAGQGVERAWRTCSTGGAWTHTTVARVIRRTG